jgi:predicted nucleic acid-binding protein
VVTLLWDASALAQRYVAETGSPSVNVLFAAIPPSQMATTILNYSETFAALLRKHHQGILDPASFAAAQAALRNEVIDDPDFVVLGLQFDDFLDGIDLIQRHHLNSADAANLRAFLLHTQSSHSPGPFLLVAADRRLLRAARAEGLATLDPEHLAAADVPAFLAGL